MVRARRKRVKSISIIKLKCVSGCVFFVILLHFLFLVINFRQDLDKKYLLETIFGIKSKKKERLCHL